MFLLLSRGCSLMVYDADGSIRFLRMVRASVDHYVGGYCTESA